MCTVSNEEVGIWASVNPLRLRLACEQLRCPYDLPVEGRYHHRNTNFSWLSTFLTGSNIPSAEMLHTLPHTNTGPASMKETMRESSKQEFSPIVPPPVITVPLTGHAEMAVVPQPSQPPPADDVQTRQKEHREEIPSMIAVQPMQDGENESKVVEGNSNKGTTTCATNSNVGGGRVSSSYEEMDEPLIVGAPKESGNPQHGILENDRGTCDVAVGSDDSHSINRFEDDQIGDIHDIDTSIESKILPEFNSFERLLSSTVERLYSKLQGTALKVVAVDDLNQQLLENMHQIKQDNIVRDETEMALHLYSLKRQVENLKSSLGEQAFLHSTFEEHHVKRRSKSVKPPRVEVVRAYEEPPVPYKKPPFTPVAYMRKQTLTHIVSSPSSSRSRSDSSISSSYVTSARSTLISSKMRSSSYDSSSSASYFSSVATYSDDFEDE